MAEKYQYAKGRRKTSVATVRLFEGKAKSTINNKEVSVLYPSKVHQSLIVEPFKVGELEPSNYYFTAVVSGGGYRSQIDALTLGISRCLIKIFPEKKKQLKDAGLLTRDPRMVERKKAGLRKARKAEQYSKR